MEKKTGRLKYYNDILNKREKTRHRHSTLAAANPATKKRIRRLDGRAKRMYEQSYSYSYLPNMKIGRSSNDLMSRVSDTVGNLVAPARATAAILVQNLRAPSRAARRYVNLAN